MIDKDQSPAEPVIEVAPGEMEWEGPPESETQRERSEYAASQRYPQVPAVPAQEAPRQPKCSLCHDVFRPCICVPYEAEPQAGAQRETHPCPDCKHECRCGLSENHCWCECEMCDCGHHDTWHELGDEECTKCSCAKFTPLNRSVTTTVPQAGAQVPSQDENGSSCSDCNTPLSLNDGCEWGTHIMCYGCLEDALTKAETHLNTIKSYATEAQKTPITREDMHDPLKAQTFYDEAKGFERLVMSEINPKGKS